MNARRRIVLGAFAALGVVAAVTIALRFELSVEVTRFMADAEERDLGAVASRLTGSSQARTLLLGVLAPDPEAALAAAGAWAEELAGHPEVAEVRAGPDPEAAEAYRELYFPRRLRFVSTAPERDVPALFSPEGLRAAAQRLRAALAAPEGALWKPLAPADPLMTFATQLRRSEAVQPWSLRVRDGRFVAGDPPRAILLVTTVHSPFDSAAQAPLLAFVAQSFEALDLRFGGALTLTQSGAHRFAVESERLAKSDAAWLTSISLVALLACFYWIFRSPLALVLSLIPLVFGGLGATAVTLALFGEMHALTLAFGGTLIGICTDYPLHLLSHCALRERGADVASVARRLRAPLWLAAGTTAMGFLVLASADLPGIREVGVFALVGVTLAVLATLVLLPELMPATIGPTPAQLRLTAWLARSAAPGRGRRWLAAGAAAAAVAACIAGLPRLRWDDDVFRLNVALRPEWVEEDAALRRLVAESEMERLAIAIAADDEAALQLDARLSERLRAAQAAGEIQGFRSVQALVWPRSLQERNWRAVEAEPRAAERVAAAFETEGFRADAFAEFAQDLRSPQPPPLTLADLLASPLGSAVAAFRVELEDGRVALLSPLRGVRDGDALARSLADLPDVYLFDAKRFAGGIYARYRERSLRAVAIGALAVIAVLALRYRRIDRIWLAAAPAALAAGATLGLLSLAGVTLSLLHLLGVLLVLCLGVDYGIFLVESREVSREEEAASLFSVGIDCLTTLLSFGLLSASSFPALSALGTSTSLGVCLSLLLVLAFRALIPAPETSRGEREA